MLAWCSVGVVLGLVSSKLPALSVVFEQEVIAPAAR